MAVGMGSGDLDYLSLQNLSSSPEALQEIAGRRPDLAAQVLAHPNIYPELSEWLLQVNPALAGELPAQSFATAPQASLPAGEPVPANGTVPAVEATSVAPSAAPSGYPPQATAVGGLPPCAPMGSKPQFGGVFPVITPGGHPQPRPTAPQPPPAAGSRAGKRSLLVVATAPIAYSTVVEPSSASSASCV